MFITSFVFQADCFRDDFIPNYSSMMVLAQTQESWAYHVRERVNDVLAEAVEIVKKVDYDFSRVEQGFDGHGGLAYLVRARDFDRAIGRYVARYPEATVVNSGAGLDTTFSRVDNGKIRWYDLDLPDGIAFRQQFIPETPRSTCIAESVFDYAWFDEVEFQPEGGFFSSRAEFSNTFASPR